MRFDEPKPEVPYVDRNPERGYADAERLARILSITPRQVRRLAADRIIRREPGGQFKGQFQILPAVDRYIEYRSKRRSAKAERRDKLQGQILQRRLDAEQASLIPMAEALVAVDHIVGAFDLAFHEIGCETVKVVADPVRAALAIGHTKTELRARFARLRRRVVEGK